MICLVFIKFCFVYLYCCYFRFYYLYLFLFLLVSIWWMGSRPNTQFKAQFCPNFNPMDRPIWGQFFCYFGGPIASWTIEPSQRAQHGPSAASRFFFLSLARGPGSTEAGYGMPHACPAGRPALVSTDPSATPALFPQARHLSRHASRTYTAPGHHLTSLFHMPHACTAPHKGTAFTNELALLLAPSYSFSPESYNSSNKKQRKRPRRPRKKGIRWSQSNRCHLSCSPTKGGQLF